MAALTLGTVYEQTKRKYQLKLLAGEEGLHRSLRWLYFSENIENANFLRGGELMLLTGFSLRTDSELREFLTMLIEQNACGVIINVGKYILEESLSEDLLALCNQHQFPLIVMPWRVHLTDIIHDYNQQIFFRTQEQQRIGYIFQMLLIDSKLCSEEDEARLLASQFQAKGQYCVGVISYQKEQVDGGRLAGQDLQILAENHLNQEEFQLCVFPYRNQLVLVFHRMGQEKVTAALDGILKLYARSYPDHRFSCGLSAQRWGVAELRESHSRATVALHFAVSQGKSQIRFEDLGVYQLFYTCRDPAVLDQFTGIVAPLEDYDKQTDGQLVETLQYYLRLQGSVNLVSEAMYCHRNTTNYRIKKIKNILDVDLDQREVLFRLQMAFYVREYQKTMETEAEGRL